MTKQTTTQLGFDGNTFSFTMRVYYEDTDLGGIVYHANYIKFYERARTEMLLALGIDQTELHDQRIGFVVKRLNVDNMAPAKFNDDLCVKAKITQLKKVSFVFQQWVELDGKVINKAEIMIASVDLDTMKLTRLPAAILEEFKRVS